ncbi:MAG: Hsp70 family protein, partial [Myxococcota bacterium]
EIGQAAVARLRARAEAAKKALSDGQTAHLEGAGELDRPTFEALTRPLRDRMARCMREALLQSRLRPDDIDAVLLVGGATRMPAVARVAEEVFGVTPESAYDVDQIVALGAAVQAGLVARHTAVRDRASTDVLTHSLGVAVQRVWGDTVFDDRFAPVLHRGTTLPASRVERFSTVHPEQSYVRFRIFEGESRDVADNDELATLRLDDLPTHEGTERLEAIDVRFTHDTSGLLEVEATLASTGEQVRTELARGGVRLTDEELAAGHEVIARLKTHPRDLLPNRWLLERATRVVEQLTGGPRESLDHLLTAFEASLEHGDPSLIENHRRALRRQVEQIAQSVGLELD